MLGAVRICESIIPFCVIVVNDLDLTSGNSVILSGLENLEDLHLCDTSMLTRHRRQ